MTIWAPSLIAAASGFYAIGEVTSGGGGGGGGPVIDPTGQVAFIGRNIYNAASARILPRGPELTFPESDITDLDNIAATGANAIRVLVTVDALNGVTPTSLGEFLARVRYHGMIAWVSFYAWNEGANFAVGAPLGGGNFYNLTAPAGYGTCSIETPGPCYLGMWDRQWVFDLMSEYRDVVIIDAMQEYKNAPGTGDTPAGRAAWRDDAISHITFFRERGYTQPLAIMSNFEGRDLAAIDEHHAAILAADTVTVNGQPQIIFGWQAYWSPVGNDWYKTWQGSLLLGAGQSLTAAQAISTIVASYDFPIQCGFDNYAGDTASDYDEQIEAAAAVNVPWLWWDWRGGQLDCPLDGATCRTYVLTSSSGFAGARTALSGGGGGSGGGTPVGGQSLDVYYNLNSLYNHAAGAGNLNTRTGNWVKRLALQAPNGGNGFTLGARFGFFPQWGFPPRASSGFEEVTTPYINEYAESWVGAQNIELVGFVPDNFNGVLFDPNVATMDGLSYQGRLLEHIDAWEANAANAGRRYAIYAGWNQLNGFGGSNDDPTTVPVQGYANWVAYGLGAYQTWMELLVSRLQAARPGLDIRLHNVSKAVLMTYRDTVVSTIPVASLFEDLAPHGRSTWYFLAGVAEYIEMYGEKPPAGFVFDPAWGVHATVTSNYQSIVDFIWGVLRP